MNLLISWSSLLPSLGLCQNFLMWVDFPEKMASIYFLHSHQIEYHCRTNEPCTQAMEGKDEKNICFLNTELFYIYSLTWGTPELSSLAPSHHFDLRANVSSSEGSLLTSIKPLPSPMTRYMHATLL